MREEAEVQAGIHNYLLPPSLKLCCAISYGLFWERRDCDDGHAPASATQQRGQAGTSQGGRAVPSTFSAQETWALSRGVMTSPAARAGVQASHRVSGDLIKVNLHISHPPRIFSVSLKPALTTRLQIFSFPLLPLCWFFPWQHVSAPAHCSSAAMPKRALAELPTQAGSARAVLWHQPCCSSAGHRRRIFTGIFWVGLAGHPAVQHS